MVWTGPRENWTGPRDSARVERNSKSQSVSSILHRRAVVPGVILLLLGPELLLLLIRQVPIASPVFPVLVAKIKSIIWSLKSMPQSSLLSFR